jgi:hypothetical protein
MPDKETGSLKKFMTSPELYSIGHENACFSVKIFINWMLYGLF